MSVTQQEIQSIIDNAQTTADTYSQLAQGAADQAETVASSVLLLTEPTIQDAPDITIDPLEVPDLEIEDRTNDIIGPMSEAVQQFLTEAKAFRSVLDSTNSTFEDQLASLLNEVDNVDVDIDGAAADIEDELDHTRQIVESAISSMQAALPQLSAAQNEAFPEQKLQELIDNGLIGVSMAANEARYARARDRVRSELHWQDQELMSAMAQRGFSMPPGVVARQAQRMQIEAQRNLRDTDRELNERENQLDIENARMVMQAQGQADSWALEEHKLFLDNARLLAQFKLDLGQSITQSQINLFNAYQQGKVSLTELKVRVAQLLVGARETAIQAIATYIDARVRGVSAVLDAHGKVAQVHGEIGRVLTNFFQAQVSAKELVARVGIANSRNSLDAQTESARLDVDVDKTRAQVTTEFAGLATRASADSIQSRVQAAIGAADAFSEIASSALAALNTVASLSSETQEDA